MKPLECTKESHIAKFLVFDSLLGFLTKQMQNKKLYHEGFKQIQPRSNEYQIALRMPSHNSINFVNSTYFDNGS